MIMIRNIANTGIYDDEDGDDDDDDVDDDFDSDAAQNKEFSDSETEIDR